MDNAKRRITILVVTLLACMCFASEAQVNPSAHKSSEVSVFGGYLSLRPAYSGFPFTDSGASLGVDFTHYFRFPVAPSFEIRANVANGGVNEKSYVVGFRFTETNLGRYHPYFDALVGKGSIHYNGLEGADYPGDNSAVYDLGGGLNIDMTRNFQFMADFQVQRWYVGPPSKFYPTAALIGLNYKIPFRNHVSQRDLGR